MLIEAQYDIYAEAKAMFETKDRVYLDFSYGKKEKETKGPYRIKSIEFNQLSRVFMYSFYDTQIVVGENYVKQSMNDPARSINSAIFKLKHEIGILDEGMLAGGKIACDGVRSFAGKMALLFWRPNRVFLQWIVDYAAGRMIIDIGCGTGFNTQHMLDMGARICGIDPYFSYEDYNNINMSRIQAQKPMLQIIPKAIEDVPELIRGKGDKIMLLFARPCHSDFVKNALDMCSSGTEALYITVPENLEKYNDLGRHKLRSQKIQHEGWSVDKEIVISIK